MVWDVALCVGLVFLIAGASVTTTRRRRLRDRRLGRLAESTTQCLVDCACEPCARERFVDNQW